MILPIRSATASIRSLSSLRNGYSTIFEVVNFYEKGTIPERLVHRPGFRMKHYIDLDALDARAEGKEK